MEDFLCLCLLSLSLPLYFIYFSIAVTLLQLSILHSLQLFHSAIFLLYLVADLQPLFVSPQPLLIIFFSYPLILLTFLFVSLSSNSSIFIFIFHLSFFPSLFHVSFFLSSSHYPIIFSSFSFTLSFTPLSIFGSPLSLSFSLFSCFTIISLSLSAFFYVVFHTYFITAFDRSFSASFLGDNICFLFFTFDHVFSLFLLTTLYTFLLPFFFFSFFTPSPSINLFSSFPLQPNSNLTHLIQI
ncbi:unnamed protein product [Acanthosepion pharaonis]|uniref:Uncharacterized protein n=1 Tax=Acanthosepion pharaonis TaxID=158019 RepID=A0A812B1P2_ACAPH|nr:unnamed protein product [Sepia pharaonis]